MTAAFLDDKVLALEAAFAKARLPHAFGGALALAYYATPRGTVDIDVNVFVPPSDVARVFALVAALGVDPGGEAERAQVAANGQVRLYWEHTPIDLFFAYDPLHDRCLTRRRRVGFGGDDSIHILSAEDLVVFKVIFDRPKDARDIADVIFALGDDFDRGYAREWLVRILDAEDARLAQFEALWEGEGPAAS
ncbi:MAG: nucleotidyltransferase family protein [Proteobacteria bacterium]|nr:nucleotidyltransferase family protein [Pseudomonadota bacterium]